MATCNRGETFAGDVLTAVLGINAVFHDSAAALVVDGETVAAVEEERLSRLANPSRAFSANPKEAPA